MDFVLPLRHDALTPFFQLLSALGGTLFYLVALAVLYWLGDTWLGDRATFRRLAFLITLAAIFNSWLKGVFEVPRPTSIPWLTAEEGYSFPSGHAQLAATAWIWLVLAFPRRTWLVGLASFAILGIAASRVYLGVHTPRDVFAGILVGALTVVVAWRPLHLPPAFWQKLPGLLRCILWAAAIGLLLAFFPGGGPDHVALISAGALLGFQVGYLLEQDRREPLRRGWPVFFALLLGLGVALALRIVGKLAFPALGASESVADFLRYFCIAFWVVYLAPRAFLRLGLATQTSNPDIT